MAGTAVQRADAVAAGSAVAAVSTLGATSISKAKSPNTSDIVQMLERELASERLERQKEVSFLTTLHQREVELLKGRAKNSAQQLEEERGVFERESSALIARVASAEEKLRKQEDEQARLERVVATLRADLEEARSALRRAEAASQEAARAHDVERQANRDLASQEQDSLLLLVQRTEEEARLAAQAGRQGEFTAQQDVKHLEQELRSAEHASWSCKQQEAQLLMELQANAEQHAKASAAQAATQEAELLEQVRRWEHAHQAMSHQVGELEAQLQAETQSAREARALDAIAAERNDTAFRGRLKEQEVGFELVLERARSEHASTQRKLCAEGEALNKDLSAANCKLAELWSQHEVATNNWEEQLKEANSRLLNVQDRRSEADAERNIALHEESEVATLLRVDLSRMRCELCELRRLGAQSMREAGFRAERESELREARESALLEEARGLSAQVYQLEATLSEEAAQRVRGFRATFGILEEEHTRDQATIQALRSEACLREASAKVQAKRLETESAKRTKEEIAERQLALDSERSRRELRQVEAQLDFEQVTHREMSAQLKDCEAAKAVVTNAHHQLWEESLQLAFAYRFQEQRNVELEGSMRSHVEQLDRDVFEFSKLREALSNTFGAVTDECQHLENGSGCGGLPGGGIQLGCTAALRETLRW